MEPDPKNPEQMLENIENLDTARMTLRWALERIRGLEGSMTESQRMLKEALSARDRASAAVANQKHDLESRTRSLAEKERFVADMQKMLNDLFKGEVQVSDFVRMKQELTEEKRLLEGRVQERLAEIDISHKKELQQHNEQLTEIESSYAGALAQAQKRYHAQIEEARRQHDHELTAQKEKYDEFREEVLSEGRLQEDQYHQKMVLLERDFSKRHMELQKDFEAVKSRIAEDQTKVWAEEKKRIEQVLRDREEKILSLERNIRSLDAAYHEKSLGEAQAARDRITELTAELRAEKESQILAMRVEHQKQSDQHAAELENIRRELLARDEEYKAGRLRLLEEQNGVREEGLQGLQNRLEEQEKAFREQRDKMAAENERLRDDQNRRHREEIEELRRSLLKAEESGRNQEREQTEMDLNALRKFYDGQLTREKTEAKRHIENAECEIAAARKRFEEKLSSADAAHLGELEALRTHFDARIGAIAEAHAKETETARLRDDSQRKSRLESQAQETGKLREYISTMQAELKARQVAFQLERESLNAAHSGELEALRTHFDARIGALAGAHTQESETARLRDDSERKSRLESQSQETGKLREYISTMQAELKAQQVAFQSERESLKQEERSLLENTSHLYEARIREMEKAQTEERARRQEEIRKHYQELFEASKVEFGAQIQSLQSECDTLRRRLPELEKDAEARSQAVRDRFVEREKELRDLIDAQQLEHQQRTRSLLEETERLARESAEKTTQIVHKASQEKDALILDISKEKNQLVKELQEQHHQGLEKILDSTRTPLGLQLERTRAFLAHPRVLAAALAFAGIAVSFFIWANPSPPKDYTVPFSHATSLVWQGETLWATDWFDQSLYRLVLTSKGLASQKRFPIPRSRITGMTLVEGKVFLADALNKEIQRWSVDKDRLIMEQAWSAPGESISALHYDGKHLWSADLNDQRIYQHLLDDALTIISSYPASQAPVGLYSDKDRFWSADAESRLVFRHRWDDSLTAVESYSLPELLSEKKPLTAFTLRGKMVWIAIEGSGQLKERPLSAFVKGPVTP